MQRLHENDLVCQRRRKSPPTVRSKTRPVCGADVERDGPRPPRRRWSGFRSRGGCGFQEAVVISPVSGSAAAFAGRGARRRLRLFVSVALAIQRQKMGMMREANEKLARETLAAGNSGPLLKGKSRVEYFKQKLRAGLRERHIAEFINDQQFAGGGFSYSRQKVGNL